MKAGSLGWFESQPRKKLVRLVERIQVDADTFARLCGFVHHLLKNRRTDALAAILGEQRDVQDVNLAFAAVHVDSANPAVAQQDDALFGSRVFGLVMSQLRRVLEPDEGFPLFSGPGSHRQFLLAGAAVNGRQERFVFRLHRAK